MQNKTGISFFYVNDGLHHSVNGISSFIININGRNDQHLQCPKSGEQPAMSADKFAEQRNSWGTSYKFNSKFIRRGMLNLHFSIFQLSNFINFPTF